DIVAECRTSESGPTLSRNRQARPPPAGERLLAQRLPNGLGIFWIKPHEPLLTHVERPMPAARLFDKDERQANRLHLQGRAAVAVMAVDAHRLLRRHELRIATPKERWKLDGFGQNAHEVPASQVLGGQR